MITRTMEIPLPTPFSVIRSPIHIRTVEPAVNAATSIITENALKCVRYPLLPKPMDIARDSKTDNTTVTIRVNCVSFFLPSSPSLWISSSLGKEIVRSWIMMEDVIYGVILNAKIDIFSKDPPVIALKKFKESPALPNNCLKTSGSTPGTGSCDPIRTTINIRNVKNNRLRMSLILNALRRVVSIRSPQLFHLRPRSSP